ncbi:hypothetical protein KR044_011298, partial [Drosophila immigrans]
MSQRRGGFRLDATTMGLNTSKKPTKQSEPPKATAQDSTETSTEVATEIHNPCQPLKLEPVGSGGAERFKGSVEQLRGICGDGAKMNFEMNDMFLKRLQSIDTQGGGDSEVIQNLIYFAGQLRMVTLQDWVDHLLHVNYMLFGNMSALEMDVFQKIMDSFKATRGEQQQTLDENRRLRKDLCAIIKLVQEAYHHNKWNTNDMCLETMTLNQLLGLQEFNCQPPESEAEKVTKCMKSLAGEVAAKHDEVCQLQTQLKAMDEIVQTARQKIMLKDECIAQLNQQVVEMQDCVSKMTKDTSNERLAAIDSCGNLQMVTSSCLFESLNQKDQQTSELLRMLNNELTEFIDLVSKNDLEAIDHHRKLLSCFFERISLERTTTLRNLDSLRYQLRNMDCNNDDMDAPIASSTEIIQDEGDAQLIDALRRRLQSINDYNKQLNVKIQQTETQYRVQLLELQYSYEAERSINQKNCQALKEIADLLSKLRCSNFSYEELYADTSASNPFCMVITEMHDKLCELQNSTVMEELCQNTNVSEDCPHRQQLEHSLLHCQTQSEMLQATRDNYLSIIVEFQRDLEELTEQVEQQQQQHLQQLQQTEDPEQSLAESPPSATSELELQNERLLGQIHNLKSALGDREDQIQQLRSVMTSYADAAETNRLKDEISSLKQRNSEQAQKICEIAALLKQQEEERQKLCNNYEHLLNAKDEQSKELRLAKKNAQNLMDRLTQVEKTQEDLKTERNLLREEIIALKEKEARSTGRERAMTDQLKCRQEELEKSRTLLRDMHLHLKHQERQHKETVDRLCQANEQIQQQMQAVSCECKQMQLKLKQQTHVAKQQQQIIDTFRKWKDAQIRSDDAMRLCIKRAEDHITMLLEENQRLNEEYKRLYGDYSVLESEMRRIKKAVN